MLSTRLVLQEGSQLSICNLESLKSLLLGARGGRLLVDLRSLWFANAIAGAGSPRPLVEALFLRDVFVSSGHGLFILELSLLLVLGPRIFEILVSSGGVLLAQDAQKHRLHVGRSNDPPETDDLLAELLTGLFNWNGLIVACFSENEIRSAGEADFLDTAGDLAESFDSAGVGMALKQCCQITQDPLVLKI